MGVLLVGRVAWYVGSLMGRKRKKRKTLLAGLNGVFSENGRYKVFLLSSRCYIFRCDLAHYSRWAELSRKGAPLLFLVKYAL